MSVKLTHAIDILRRASGLAMCFVVAALVAGIGGGAPQAYAASCPEPGENIRVFTLTTTSGAEAASCVATGTGNLSGGWLDENGDVLANPDAFLNTVVTGSNPAERYGDQGVITLSNSGNEKDPEHGGLYGPNFITFTSTDLDEQGNLKPLVESTRGTFSFAALPSSSGPVFFGLQTGQGGELDPDWAVFTFTLTGGTTSVTGDWSFTGNQGFTHGNLYANPDDAVVVPIPGAIWLFASALIGLVGVSRFKNRQAPAAA